MDEELRRHERRAEGDDAEALVRAALAHRRTGQLEKASEALERAVELSPKHELARALLVMTNAALGKKIHGSFLAAEEHGVDLVRFLDPSSLAAIARSAVDPAHGQFDASAVASLLRSGKQGALAVLNALVPTNEEPKIAFVLLTHVFPRDVAAAGIARDEVPRALAEYVLGGLRACGYAWEVAPLAGALKLEGARELLEIALLSPDRMGHVTVNAIILGLELLADPLSRPALEKAFARATTPAEKLLIDRALTALRGR